MRNFVGRADYLRRLEDLWKGRRTKLLCLYGRRRVGKTELIRQFCKGKKTLYFEALEGEDTPTQLRHFLAQLSEQCGEPFLRDLNYQDWPLAFDLLTRKLEAEKDLVLVFDELSWMAAGRGKLVSYLKYYWDRKWKSHSHLLLILCGSVASWMIKNVVRSTALYGRVSETFLIEPFKPFEVMNLVGAKRGRREVLEYLICFGGIPRYLEEFDFNKSIQINIERTCFRRSGFFVEEADKIFYSQFKEIRTYKQITGLLLKGPLTIKDVSQKLKLPSGGGLKQYLENLVLAGILEKIPVLRDFETSKLPRYHMGDEFLRFHATFIAPHWDEILHGEEGTSFEKMTRGRWHSFLGLAFERFCLKQRYRIARVLGISDKVTAAAGIMDAKGAGYQYDLVYLRSDHVITVCEIKHLSHPAETGLIREMESKLAKTKFPRGATVEKILICNQDPSTPLQKSGYFHRILTAGEIVEGRK